MPDVTNISMCANLLHTKVHHPLHIQKVKRGLLLPAAGFVNACHTFDSQEAGNGQTIMSYRIKVAGLYNLTVGLLGGVSISKHKFSWQ